MILPPELTDLEKKFITSILSHPDNSVGRNEKQLPVFLGEVFLTLLASELLPISKMEEVFSNYEGSKTEIAFLDLFLQVISFSNILSLLHQT